MSERLKNVLQFAGLAPGATAILPHDLHTSLGVPLAPDIVFIPTNELSVTSDDLSVTITNTGGLTLAGDILVESWHTLERAFNDVATTDLQVKPYVVTGGTAGLTAPEFAPARTLFVAQSWPAGADPLTHFTTIQAAETQAALLTPTPTNPVGILVYPGTYSGAFSAVSNVHLVGTTQQRGVIVTGIPTWIAGAGANAPQAALAEQLNVAFITFTQPWVIDTTAKTGGSVASPVMRGVILSGGTWNGTANDAAVFFASVFQGGNVFTFNNVDSVAIYATRTRNMTFNGPGTFLIAGGTTLGVINANNTGQLGYISGEVIQGNINVGAGASLRLSGGALEANLTVAAGGAADVRAMNTVSDAKLLGLGTINRTTLTMSGKVAGAVAFPNAYPDANYNVHLQLTAGAGNAGATVTLKTATQFTLTDATPGDVYDVTVIHD